MAVMVMRGLIFHLVVFSVWVRGMDSYSRVGEFVVEICEFFALYGV